MKDEKEVLVFADWLKNENVIGTLYVSSARGKQVYSFEFADSWLYNFSHIMLDPDLYNTAEDSLYLMINRYGDFYQTVCLTDGEESS